VGGNAGLAGRVRGAAAPREYGAFMIVPGPKCRMCARPMVPGTAAHLGCQDLPKSLNDWPDGTRQLSCLSCDRSFWSDSKVERLCHACRAGRAG
jgi:hypothetical protein